MVPGRQGASCELLHPPPLHRCPLLQHAGAALGPHPRLSDLGLLHPRVPLEPQRRPPGQQPLGLVPPDPSGPAGRGVASGGPGRTQDSEGHHHPGGSRRRQHHCRGSQGICAQVQSLLQPKWQRLGIHPGPQDPAAEGKSFLEDSLTLPQTGKLSWEVLPSQLDSPHQTPVF